MRTLVWFRGKDLRLDDHEPLLRALKDGEVIPLFVVDPFFFSKERARKLPHRIQFLLDALREVAEQIRALGSELILVPGRSVEVIPKLVRTWRVDRVVAYRWTEPFGVLRDERVEQAVKVPFDLFEGETLMRPDAIRTQSGDAYRVFTPFYRSFLREFRPERTHPAPTTLPPIPEDVHFEPYSIPTLGSLGLKRNPSLLTGGAQAARVRLQDFLRDGAEDYEASRNRIDSTRLSRLSADLKFGTISVRAVWHRVAESWPSKYGSAREAFLRQLVWREFAYMNLANRPQLLQEPFRKEWGDFPWRDDECSWRAWSRGETGYPVVDAASRQLRSEGYVHGRARMIAASFLCKHLMIDYRRGEAEYLKWLTDGDWAQNNMGWQWSAGCGCDAQPYFRVFNPTSQGERYDRQGTYIKRWLPELADLPARYIHRPWEAPATVLVEAGVALGSDYPAPVVDHRMARERFLSEAKAYLHRVR